MCGELVTPQVFVKQMELLKEKDGRLKESLRHPRERFTLAAMMICETIVDAISEGQGGPE